MTLSQIQSVLKRCEVPGGEYIAANNGLTLRLKVAWLGDWLTHRDYHEKARTGDTAIVNFTTTEENFWQSIETEEEIIHLAYAFYRAAMLHETAEFFLFDNKQIFDPHCTTKRTEHREHPHYHTLLIERAFMDKARCDITSSNRSHFGIPMADVFPR